MLNSSVLTRGTLDVPGAHLCYEVRGSGPTLLLIPGGPADAGAFAQLVPQLATDYSVVTYDPRGLSRSTVDDPDLDIPVDIQADDAHRLLSVVTTEPAYVFGSSGGAITGLALVSEYPDRIKTLVAHEPPLVTLLPDRDQMMGETALVYERYLNEGPGPAMVKFLAMAGFNGNQGRQQTVPVQETDPEMYEAMARMQKNLNLFFGNMFREIVSYVPNVTALRSASTRVVVGRGTASDGQLACRTAVALAENLGTAPVQFPGDHGGYSTDAEAFARILRQIL